MTCREVLAPLGIGVVMEVPGAVGLGKDKKPSLWLGEHREKPPSLHIAFIAENREQVVQVDPEDHRGALVRGERRQPPH